MQTSAKILAKDSGDRLAKQNPKAAGSEIIVNLSQACLSPWQIDLAEIFSTNRDSTATEENLSRLESFLTAYFIRQDPRT